MKPVKCAHSQNCLVLSIILYPKKLVVLFLVVNRLQFKALAFLLVFFLLPWLIKVWCAFSLIGAQTTSGKVWVTLERKVGSTSFPTKVFFSARVHVLLFFSLKTQTRLTLPTRHAWLSLHLDFGFRTRATSQHTNVRLAIPSHNLFLFFDREEEKVLSCTGYVHLAVGFGIVRISNRINSITFKGLKLAILGLILASLGEATGVCHFDCTGVERRRKRRRGREITRCGCFDTREMQRNDHDEEEKAEIIWFVKWLYGPTTAWPTLPSLIFFKASHTSVCFWSSTDFRKR